MAEKAYKFRAYPTPKQASLLAKIFGCRRFIYNYFLRYSQWFYEMTGSFLGYNNASAILTVVKQSPEFVWLNEADKFALQNTLRDLFNAFTDFF